MDRKLRIGIIGTGTISNKHAAGYKALEDVCEVVACADIVPGKAQEFIDRHGFKAQAFENHKDLLKLDLDAVSICTYNTQHAPCAIDAMRAGKHVLLEKPMCVTMEEATELLRVEKETGKILTIGFQPRYDDNMRKIKEIVQSGDLGKVYYVQIGGGRRCGIPECWTFNRKETTGVGVVGDLGCYAIDMAMNALGHPKPLTVSAITTNYFGKDPFYNGANAEKFDIEDFAVALVRLEGGITLDFRASWAMNMDTMGATLFLGTDKGLKIESVWPEVPWGGGWDGTTGPMSLYYSSKNDPEDCINEPIDFVSKTPDRGIIFNAKVKAFVDAVLTGGKAPIPTSEIIYNQAIIDGIARSAALGREVEIVIPEI